MTRLFLPAIVVLWPLVAAGADDRVISHARITVSDVARAADDVGAVDLGPAPPPGGSRLFGRGEIEDKVRAAGLDPKALKLPPSVRVVSASQRWTPAALAKAAEPAVMRALPAGVTLTKIDATHDIVTMPGCVVRAATIPRLPRQRGTAQSTAMLELGAPDEEGRPPADRVKIPVSITVEISEAAARADVPRGARVELILERGAVRIATVGVALADAEVGDVTQMSLVATSRVVRARIVSRERADVVEGP